MKKLLFKIYKLFVEINENTKKRRLQPFGLKVAGIHATILSVFIAIISAYIFVSFIILKDLEKNVLEEAEKINLVQFARCGYGLEKDELPRIKTFKDLWNQVCCLIFLMDCKQQTPELLESISSYCIIPEDTDKCAKKFFVLLYHLNNKYPFPVETTLKLGDWPMHGPKAIHFEGIEKVQDWLIALNNHLYALRLIDNQMVVMGTPDKMLKTLYDKNKELIENKNIKRLKYLGGHEYNPYTLFNNFFKNKKMAEHVLISTYHQLQRYEKFKANIFSMPLMVIIMIFGILAFLAGILWPILHNNYNYYLANLLPISFYVIVVTVLVYKLFGFFY